MLLLDSYFTKHIVTIKKDKKHITILLKTKKISLTILLFNNTMMCNLCIDIVIY